MYQVDSPTEIHVVYFVVASRSEKWTQLALFYE